MKMAFRSDGYDRYFTGISFVNKMRKHMRNFLPCVNCARRCTWNLTTTGQLIGRKP